MSAAPSALEDLRQRVAALLPDGWSACITRNIVIDEMVVGVNQGVWQRWSLGLPEATKPGFDLQVWVADVVARRPPHTPWTPPRRFTRRGVDEWQTEIAAYLPSGWSTETCQRTSDQLDAVRLWCGSREAAVMTVDELAALPHLGEWVSSVVEG